MPILIEFYEPESFSLELDTLGGMLIKVERYDCVSNVSIGGPTESKNYYKIFSGMPEDGGEFLCACAEWLLQRSLFPSGH